jgi:putative hydrolase of HD superfamily
LRRDYPCLSAKRQHGTLLTRIVVGNVVIDHETVTRTFPEGSAEVEVVCIYEVENGKIAKA